MRLAVILLSSVLIPFYPLGALGHPLICKTTKAKHGHVVMICLTPKQAAGFRA
jgi:hypothetical protein